MPVFRVVGSDTSSNGWTTVERGDIVRTRTVLESLYGSLDLEFGETDQGHPWASLSENSEGLVIAHFARLPDHVIVDFPELGLSYKGFTLTEALARIAANTPAVEGRRSARRVLARLFDLSKKATPGLVSGALMTLWETVQSQTRRSRTTDRQVAADTSLWNPAKGQGPAAYESPTLDILAFLTQITATLAASKALAQPSQQSSGGRDIVLVEAAPSSQRSAIAEERDNGAVPPPTPADQTPVLTGPKLQAPTTDEPAATPIALPAILVPQTPNAPQQAPIDFFLLAQTVLGTDHAPMPVRAHHGETPHFEPLSRHHHGPSIDLHDLVDQGWVLHAVAADGNGNIVNFYVSPDSRLVVATLGNDHDPSSDHGPQIAHHDGATADGKHGPETAIFLLGPAETNSVLNNDISDEQALQLLTALPDDHEMADVLFDDHGDDPFIFTDHESLNETAEIVADLLSVDPDLIVPHPVVPDEAEPLTFDENTFHTDDIFEFG